MLSLYQQHFFYVSFLIQLKKLQIKCTQKFRRKLFVLFFSKDKAFFGSDKNCSYRKLAWYKSRLCFLHDAGLPRWMRWKGRWWPWSPSSQRRRPSNTCVCYKGFNAIDVSMFCGPWLLAPTHPPPLPHSVGKCSYARFPILNRLFRFFHAKMCHWKACSCFRFFSQRK